MQTVQSEVDAIHIMVLKHPRDAFVNQEIILGQWKELGYTDPPHFEESIKEYDRFLNCIAKYVPNIHFLPKERNVTLDSIYVRDASVVCGKGVILCNMGKTQRSTEPGAQEALYRALGIPIVGRIKGPGTLEGGDVVWLNERTLAVARSYRTNWEGIRQLEELLDDCVNEIVVVDLPHWRGPEDVFHLMSIISPIDKDLALVYSPLMPIGFREKLLSLSINLVEVPAEEFATMGCNVLALAPRKCLMVSGNQKTKKRLEAEGVDVLEFPGTEICIKGGGGPTCLTRPILRSPVQVRP